MDRGLNQPQSRSKMCAGDIQAAEKDQDILAYLQGSIEVPVQTYYLGAGSPHASMPLFPSCDQWRV